MLFNSYEFVIFFLPITLFVYFFLNKQKLVIASKAWLVLTSLFFYGWWNIVYVPLIIGSICFNFAVGSALVAKNNVRNVVPYRKVTLVVGIIMNLALLGYFKYTNFFIENLNFFAGSSFPALRIILPLGISFFTFTQIAFLVDSYKKTVKECNYLNYSLFVTFFPHLLAGPIIHHKEMMPQFDSLKCKIFNYKNFYTGIVLFTLGLGKKVIVADYFAFFANAGFSKAGSLTFFDSWITVIAYAFQLYFDFSGYTDMAIGSSLMFNIKLPFNFDSPYKALDIQDFWRRWHITLSRFLRDYIYIPLGGNKISETRMYVNLMLTFLIGGFWHGAGWTFLFWGFLHGFGLIVNRLWKKLNLEMPRFLAWFITFNFVIFAWVFFRARNFMDALEVIKGMLGLKGGVCYPQGWPNKLWKIWLIHYDFPRTGLNVDFYTCMLFLICLFIIVRSRNSNSIAFNFKFLWRNCILITLALVYFINNLGKVSEFIYFNF